MGDLAAFGGSRNPSLVSCSPLRVEATAPGSDWHPVWVIPMGLVQCDNCMVSSNKIWMDCVKISSPAFLGHSFLFSEKLALI